MAIIYSYLDPYLGNLVTEALETEAINDITEIYASFSADWLAKLVPLRAYILLCTRNQTQPDDVYSLKLATYRKEFQAQLDSAKASTTDATTGLTLNPFTLRIDRA